MKRKIICAAAVILTIVNLGGMRSGAAIITKSSTLTFSYYDSVITSWLIGRIRGTYQFSYNNVTQRLEDQKSITHSTSNIAFGCGFKDIEKIWHWYNTASYNGTGYGVVSWSFGIGIITQWISLGNFQDDWMSLTVRGSGTSSAGFSP